MRRRWHPHCSALLTAIATIALFDPCSGAEDEAALRERIYAILREHWGKDLPQGEAECLKLLKDFRSAENKAFIYSKLAAAYAVGGAPEPLSCQKTAEYCQKALSCPLPTYRKLLMFSYWAGSLVIKSRDLTGEGFLEARRKAAEIFLRGLQVVAAEQRPREEWDVDIVPWQLCPELHDVFLDGAVGIDEEKVRRVEAAQRAKLHERRLQQLLLRTRKGFIRRCVSLYSRPPAARHELEQMGRSLLGESDILKEILSQLPAPTDHEGASIEPREATAPSRVPPAPAARGHLRPAASHRSEPASEETLAAREATRRAPTPPDITLQGTRPPSAGRAALHTIGLTIAGILCGLALGFLLVVRATKPRTPPADHP